MRLAGLRDGGVGGGGGAGMAIGLTADTNQNQAEALQLTSTYNVITICANAGDAVRLPSAVPALSVAVRNNGAARLAVFPDVDETLGRGADVADTLEPGESATWVAIDVANYIEMTGPGSRGGMLVHGNSTAQVINAADELHGMVTDGMAADAMLRGFSFQAGETGAIDTIVDASGVGGAAGDIRCTTNSPHAMSIGDVVVNNDLANPNYVGVFVVTDVPDNTHYDITTSFSFTGFGSFQRPDALTASEGTRGPMMVVVCKSGGGVANGETFDWFLGHQTAIVQASYAGEQRRKFGMGGDVGPISLCARRQVGPGDIFFLLMNNIGASGNVVQRNVELHIHRSH